MDTLSHVTDPLYTPHRALSCLDIDVLLSILALLPVRDILAIRQTCRRLHNVSRLRPVWHAALATHVLAADLPVPAPRDADTDTGPDALEHRVRAALAFRANWEQAHPARCRGAAVATAAARVLFLRFLPGPRHRFLLSFGYMGSALYSVQVWDLRPAVPRCAGEWSGLAAVLSLGVNMTPSSPGTFALTVRTDDVTKIQVFQFDDAADCFEDSVHLLKELSLQGRIMTFQGDLIVINTPDGSLFVVNWIIGCELFLLNPGYQVHIVQDLILVFREAALEFYQHPTSIDSSQCAELRPLDVHRWGWKINSLAVSERVSWAHRHARHGRPAYAPLSILVRFDSWFPWPVNLIHHFVLAPADDGARAAAARYALPPRLQDTLASSVRLFGRAEMAVSRFGTALWLDSEGDAAVHGGADVGERIAGMRVGLGLGGGGGGGRVAEQHAPPAMLFATREQEGWNAIALDEEAGRIAVGDVDGRIELWEYL